MSVIFFFISPILAKMSKSNPRLNLQKNESKSHHQTAQTQSRAVVTMDSSCQDPTQRALLEEAKDQNALAGNYFFLCYILSKKVCVFLFLIFSNLGLIEKIFNFDQFLIKKKKMQCGDLNRLKQLVPIQF